MRIVIDLQSMQGVNQSRGVDNYSCSLTKAIIKNAKNHEIILTLNGMAQQSVQTIRETFKNLLPSQNIVVWYPPGPVKRNYSENIKRIQAAELIREAFLASLNPDMVLITSLFEGFVDNNVTSIGRLVNTIPTAVLSHDLIPLIYRDHYFKDVLFEQWYLNKIGSLRSANLILANSASSGQEVIDYLHFPDNSVFNILGAVDDDFKPQVVSSHQEMLIRQRYSLHKSFILYVGGVDYRKNVTGLIRAYAKLTPSMRSNLQLALVFAAEPYFKISLLKYAKSCGLAPQELIITGFIPKEDLINLYNICKLFVFPSWHEGFGLPILEAMSCGSAVIGSNCTSMPEVIGLEDALFDPKDDDAITQKIVEVLSNENFYKTLKRHGLEQAKKFSWDNSAIRAIRAFEIFHQENKIPKRFIPTLSKRPKLAYISPLPPQTSGIADYSAELLPELARYYEIEVISDLDIIANSWIKANCVIRSVEWFEKNFDHYQRVLYHFGNSFFHQHMFSLLKKIPGVVVLHDFFLSGIINWMEKKGNSLRSFLVELYYSHGYPAVITYLNQGEEQAICQYPVNLSVLENALGVIVHSSNSCELAKKWYPSLNEKTWFVIPHLIKEQYSPRECGDKYFESIENAYKNSAASIPMLTHAIFTSENSPSSPEEFLSISNSIAYALPSQFRLKTIFLDISQLVQSDSKTGIQRVVRNLLWQLLINPPPGIRVEPIYANSEKLGYRYARSFTLNFLGYPNTVLQDELIDYENGDIFFSIDLSPVVIPAQAKFLQKMHNHGVKIYFMVHDLLPVLMPNYFSENKNFLNWLNTLLRYDGAVCVSKAVAGELAEWVEKNFPNKTKSFEISWSHHGADFNGINTTTVNTEGLLNESHSNLWQNKNQINFLMVGTLEPRKGHAQTIAAFEQIWEAGYEVNLLIAGKEGWMVKDLIRKIRKHPLLNQRLFWFGQCDDDHLEKIYRSATCFIAASNGEGFGLPLIEAAQYKIPIIARNIPVFQEVTAGNAFYFSGAEPSHLAEAVKNWLALFKIGAHPKSDNLPWQTWEMSAKQLVETLLNMKTCHQSSIVNTILN